MSSDRCNMALWSLFKCVLIHPERVDAPTARNAIDRCLRPQNHWRVVVFEKQPYRMCRLVSPLTYDFRWIMTFRVTNDDQAHPPPYRRRLHTTFNSFQSEIDPRPTSGQARTCTSPEFGKQREWTRASFPSSCTSFPVGPVRRFLRILRNCWIQLDSAKQRRSGCMN